MDVIVNAVQVMAVIAVVLLVAQVGRRLARRVRQPGVVAEIAIGLLAGPAILAVGGRGAVAVLLPPAVTSGLRLVGGVGLCLFLVGLAHQMRKARLPGRRTLIRTTAGALLVPLVCGVGFGFWVLLGGHPQMRGGAPGPALVLLVAAAMTVTAVPVLAQILIELGMVGSEVGRLAMACAVATDAVAWLMLAAAIGFDAGGPRAVLVLLATIVGTACGALAVWWLLRTPVAGRAASRSPVGASVLIGSVAVLASMLTRGGGLTEVLGAFAIGFAVPSATQWNRAVDGLFRAGRRLVPIYFVATGLGLSATNLGLLPWTAVVVTAVAMAGKLVGGYAGARAADQPRELGLRLGVLLNTRGLSELVMLQAGLSLGILSPPLFAAFVVMSLVTTAMTGPAYAVLDWTTARRATTDAPAADFRALMSGFPSGVAVVTTAGGDGAPHGMTCSSVCSVSVTPPTLLICLRQGSPTLEAVLSHATFTVNMLHDRAQPVAELFASAAPDRFDQVAWRRDDEAGGPHLDEHAHTVADCDVTTTMPVGDHVVVFGRVARILRKTEDPPAPLMYGMRQYSAWSSYPLPDAGPPPAMAADAPGARSTGAQHR